MPSTTKEGGRLTKIQLVQIGVMIFFMGLQLTLPYTISVYMVRDFFKGGGHSEQKIAQLTGILAASQSFFRSLSAYGLGIVMDKLGRKIGALSGIAACVVSLFFYGMATNYTQALLARSIPALLISGVPVAMKAMIGDACDEKGQAIALGVFKVGHGLGSTVGPILGGALSEPCDRFKNLPYCQPGEALHNRPFLLPCLASSAFGVVAFLVTCLLMKETHPQLSQQPGGWIANLVRIICCRGSSEKKGYSLVAQESGTVARQASNAPELRSLQSDVEMGRVRTPHADESSLVNGHAHAKEKDQNKDTFEAGSHSDAATGVSGLNQNNNFEASSSEEEKWWRDRDTLLALIGSGLAAFFFNYFDEMAPIYVSAPVKEGGLAMPLSQFTYPLATAGVFTIVFSLCFYPWMVAKYSTLILCQFGMISIVPVAIMLPLASIVRTSYIAQQVLVYLSITLVQISKICALGSSMVLINLVASKKAMGRINGAGVTLQSGGRALGPTLSGTTWAISVSLHVYGQQFLGFILLIVGCVASQFVFAAVRVPNQE